MLSFDDSVEARHDLILACLRFDVPCESIPVWLAEIRQRGGKVFDLDALMSTRPASDQPASAGH
jgi:hypothetical protein